MAMMMDSGHDSPGFPTAPTSPANPLEPWSPLKIKVYQYQMENESSAEFERLTLVPGLPCEAPFPQVRDICTLRVVLVFPLSLLLPSVLGGRLCRPLQGSPSILSFQTLQVFLGDPSFPSVHLFHKTQQSPELLSDQGFVYLYPEQFHPLLSLPSLPLVQMSLEIPLDPPSQSDLSCRMNL